MSYEKILKLIRTEIADAMLEDGDLSRKEVLDDLLEGIRADLEVDEDEERVGVLEELRRPSHGHENGQGQEEADEVEPPAEHHRIATHGHHHHALAQLSLLLAHQGRNDVGQGVQQNNDEHQGKIGPDAGPKPRRRH